MYNIGPLLDEMKKKIFVNEKSITTVYFYSLQALFSISCHMNLIRGGYTLQTCADPHVFVAVMGALALRESQPFVIALHNMTGLPFGFQGI